MGESEFGRCEVCGRETYIQRTYFRYNIKCQCCSPNHFEIKYHCSNCTPKEPTETRILVKTSDLKAIDRDWIKMVNLSGEDLKNKK